MTRLTLLAGSGIFLLCICLNAQQPAVAQPASASPQTRIGVEAKEVLLDLIVRDRRGRTVRDLKPEEVEISEEGQAQPIRSFRMIEAGEVVTGPGGITAVTHERLNPARPIRLVTLAFDRLGNEARQLARDAALEFLHNQLRPNTYLAVFTIDQRLNVLQPFTNDVQLLAQAVRLATTGSSSQFASLSDAIQRKLQDLAAAQANAETAAANVGRGTETLQNAMNAFGEAKAQEILVNILRFSETLSREQQGLSSLFALLSLVKEQQTLPGRKTLLYFSEGLQVTGNLDDHLRTVISEANRANVSVYAVDARGLTTGRLMKGSDEALTESVNASRRQQMSRTGSPVTPEEAKAFDTAADSIRANTQGSLLTLAEGTGGFLVADSNDLRVPLRRVSEDLWSYYELTYVPPPHEYDGRFRSISVKVNRPGVKVQARSGYFALPPFEGSSLLPFEVPLLTALGASPLPRSFDYRAASLHFGHNARGAEISLLVDIPLKNFTFTPDRQRNVYFTRLALLALLKDSRGRVLHKFSQDIPLEAPLDKMELFQQGNFVFLRQAQMPPGRYILEVAALDRGAQQISAKRSVLVVDPPKPGVSMSSLTLIRRVEPAVAAGVPEDPFHFEQGRVIPTLFEGITRSPVSGVSFYFVVYPSKEIAEKPQLVLEFFQEGQLVAKAAPELPPADEQGRIRYIASSASENFRPGQYEVRAVVRQGTSACEEHAFFAINP